jgi:hypothetical protein
VSEDPHPPGEEERQKAQTKDSEEGQRWGEHKAHLFLGFWGFSKRVALGQRTQRSKKRNNAKPRPVPQAKSERKEAKKKKKNRTEQNRTKQPQVNRATKEQQRRQFHRR